MFQLTALIKQKVEQLEQEKEVIQSSYHLVDKNTEYMKSQLKSEYQRLLDKKKQVAEEFESKCLELEQLTLKQAAIGKDHETAIQTARERINIVKFNQQKAVQDLAKVKEEFRTERKKYDRFLSRDRERLMYINQYQNTKRLVNLSYVNELKRVKDQLARDSGLERNKSQASGGVCGGGDAESRMSREKKTQKPGKSTSVRRKAAAKNFAKDKIYASLHSSSRLKENVAPQEAGCRQSTQQDSKQDSRNGASQKKTEAAFGRHFEPSKVGTESKRCVLPAGLLRAGTQNPTNEASRSNLIADSHDTNEGFGASRKVVMLKQGRADTQHFEEPKPSDQLSASDQIKSNRSHNVC